MTDEEDIFKDKTFFERIRIKILIYRAAFNMMRQIIQEVRWKRKVDAFKVPPKVDPKDRVYKYN